MGRILGQVQNIVHNLESQAGFAAEEVQAGCVVRSGPGIDAACHHAHPDQRARLGAVNGVDEFRRGLQVFAFEVQHLAADHALDGADGVGDEADDPDDHAGGYHVGGRGR